jgi:hypothetical protein
MSCQDLLCRYSPRWYSQPTWMLVKCRSLGSVAFGVSCAITFPYGRSFQGGLGAEYLLDQVGMIGG